MTSRRFTCLLILILLVTIGCSPSSAVPEDVPTGCRIESVDQLSDKTSIMTESGEVLSPDVQYYADEFGIAVEEAAYRLNLQEPIGKLNACLDGEEKDTGIRYFGLPLGFEFEAFLQAIVNTAHGTPGLRPETVAGLAALKDPVTVTVFVARH